MATIVGWVMLVVGGGVMIAAFPGKYGTGPMAPQFLGAFGVPFALVFTVVQCVAAAQFRKAKVLWLVAGLSVGGAMLGLIGRTIDLHGFCAEHHVSYFAYVLCAGACVGGIGLGIAMIRGWVYED